MPNLSLRLPYVLYVALAGILVGVLVAPVFRADLEAAKAEAAAARDAELQARHEAMHGTREVPAEGAPEVILTVEPDSMDGWNITLETANFRFTPEATGEAPEQGTGHAHLYVDERKVARLYGPHFHLPALSEGTHEISVTLAANDHAYYRVDGERIGARQTITQTVQAPMPMDMN